MHGGGTPQSTSQALSVPAYVRKKALNSKEKLGALVLESWENLLIYNLESGFQQGMWDLCRERGVKYLRP